VSLKDLAYRAPRKTIRVLFDDSLRVEYEEAKAAFRQAVTDPDGGLDARPQQRLEAAEAAVEEAAVSFVFQAIPRHKLAELTNAHPPTPEMMERWRVDVKIRPHIINRKGQLVANQAPEFDLMEVTPRLIAASLVEPETTEEEVLELWESGDWSDAVWGELGTAAWAVNDETPTLPTSGNGSKTTRSSVPASSTQ
jgi:hypothetical protein